MSREKKPLSTGRKVRRGVLCILLAAIIGTGIGFVIDASVRSRQEEAQTESFAVADNGYSGNSVQKLLPAVTMDARAKETAARVQRSVVTILTYVVVDSPFGSEEGSAIGSGIVYRKGKDEVYVITNAHVLEGAQEIYLYFSDEDMTEATLQGQDPESDLAVLKVRSQDLSKETYADMQEAVWADSDAVRVGDTCMAVGCPYSMVYNDSVTMGIIGGTEREITYDGRTMTVMQTDAAINPGNSGGAVINMDGGVIGITSAKIQMESVEGIGFFIPSGAALPIVETLTEDGSIDRPVLGIASYDFISDTMAEIYGVPVGVVVYEVGQGPAAASGLQSGDIITKIDGEELTSLGDVEDILSKHRIGDIVELTVVRSQGQLETYTFSLKLSGSQQQETPGGSFFPNP